KMPMGFATRNTSSKNNPICNQPLTVMTFLALRHSRVKLGIAPREQKAQTYEHKRQSDKYPSMSDHDQKFSGRNRAYTRYTPVNALITSMMIDSRVILSSPHVLAEVHVSY